MSVKEQFDRIAKNYDSQRRQLIPCFADYYHLPLAMLDYEGESPAILDIGSGTGLYASLLYEKYPRANFTLIDLSEKMLSVAKERFAGLDNFEYIVEDYTAYAFDKKFDIIISALSIHHLDAHGKKNLYANCHRWLNNKGIFLNADMALSPFPETEKKLYDIWGTFIKNSGLSDDEIQQGYERVKFDNPSTMDDQLSWLREAGFSQFDIIYKYLHYCVFYAKK